MGWQSYHHVVADSTPDEVFARAQAYVRSSDRSWMADLGDDTMVAFGWAYVG